MISSRLMIEIVAASALTVWSPHEAASQAANDRALKTPFEIAKAIAHTINASTLKAPGAQIAFESAVSRDNIVEITFVANDGILSRLRRNVDQMRLSKASYYCNESRIAYLKQGIVMHEIIATSDNRDRLEFTFDLSSCSTLPKSTLADSQALAEFALTVAKAENESVPSASNSPFRLDRATAHEGIVDERFIVLDKSIPASTIVDGGKIRGVLTGYFCTRYRTFISQGLVFRDFFVLPDGSPVTDFTIDRSNC